MTFPADIPSETRIEQVEIQLGHLCNNRCVFCASGFNTSRGLAAPQDPAPVFAHLADARTRGARRVTFVGGEPTLQRELPAMLARARDLGFEHIVLFTNGVRGHQDEYLAELLRGGPLEFRVSIQGGNAETHDRVVGRPGAFARILEVLAFAHARGQRISVNACLNVLSYASVGGYARIARTYGVKQVHLDQVNPHEIGDRPPGYLGSILAQYSAEAPHLARMLADFERDLGPDYDVNLGNLPYCVMPEWAHRIHHAGEQTLVVPSDFEGIRAQGGHDKYLLKTSRKHKPAGCRECAFDPVCTGVYTEYAEKFGCDELVPVPVERLVRMRSAPRMFTLIAREPLARLLAAGAPAGFDRLAADVRPCDPEAQLLFRGPSGAEIPVAVRHASAPGTPLVTGALASVHTSVARLAAADLPLLGWVCTQLGEPAVPDLDVSDVNRRLAWGAEARDALAKLVARLVATGDARDPIVARDGESASVSVPADATRELRVRFVTRPAFERPQVRAIFPRASGDAASDPAIESIVRAMRAALANGAR